MAALAEAGEPDRDQDQEQNRDGPVAAAVARAVLEVAAPGSRPLRLLEWSVRVGWPVQIGTVLAHCLPVEQESGAERERPRPRPQEKRVKSDRAGVVKELCWQPGQVVPSGSVLVRLEGCSHPIVMKGLCAACGQDLTQLQKKNGKQMVPLSTATVSMVHSVPELMVSSEQAEQLGREDQQWLHKNRKLVLMVDLDQTLIHTTEQLCQKMSNKGIFHFQLGRGEPMLHTRLRPHCKEFLEKIAKLYELHVFTFGSRLYAHKIAGLLDPEKKLFSHRILSRDECIDPYSKTGNLRNLFPCGDSMVCIIDDREDVWKFAPNLIAVKKYIYFQGTGDINAPPGSREAQMKKRVNHSSKPAEEAEQPASTSTDSAGAIDRCGEVSEAKEQSNGLGECSKKQNGSTGVLSEEASKCAESLKCGPNTKDSQDTANERKPLCDATVSHTKTAIADTPVKVGESEHSLEGVVTATESSSEPRSREAESQLAQAGGELDFDLSSDSDSEPQEGKRDTASPSPTSSLDAEKEPRGLPGKKSRKQRKAGPGQAEAKLNHSDKGKEKAGDLPESESQDKCPDQAPEGDDDQDSLGDVGNGCADKKEAETESQNSEQSGVTMGESLDQSMDVEEEDPDEDDHLMYLETILVHVHTEYFAQYEKYLKKERDVPDLKQIVPELKSKALQGTIIIFSGLYPTNYPIEKTREWYHATALGAKVKKTLCLNPKDPSRTTHLIAARPGTEKVRQALACKHLHVVNPDWLWSSLERWERVDEKLFPLKEDYIKTQRTNSPAGFPEVHGGLQTPLFHPTPIHPKAQPGPEVRIYDPNTGKLIRKDSHGNRQSVCIQPPAPPVTLSVHGEQSSFRVVQPHQQPILEDDELPNSSQSEEKPGPSRAGARKRQPSMSETMPLYTLCKEDLESMDKEVDDILGEDSDNESESEKEEKMEAQQREQPPEETQQPDQLAMQSGATRNLKPDIETRPKSSSSEESLTGRVPRGHKRKLEDDGAGSDSSKLSSNEDDSSSEADEMAAALEAELNDFI
ncbi:LOW QUALITY PROTEIN: RNA polymerase II subunit A C-terminal domain phosphatase [Scyliorhinus canicula]|uniref:LOW QUALITY PROTEIN: RNA polymerase II subunit A C-terminal domain phosphatase n=1 Tax=Scyliorhinus canicula TaxID=7830 RepID=UPI0018F6CD03|nr:LOW QUALITY PROTEIN: RNA polymerase II subunit A C-terminal domain phosphatase [Scyliorhinus canicula]